MILPYIGFIISWIMYEGDREKAKALILGAIVSTIVTMFLPYIIYLLGDNREPTDEGDSNNSGQQIKTLMEIYKNL